jgi:hypothetical protein
MTHPYEEIHMENLIILNLKTLFDVKRLQQKLKVNFNSFNLIFSPIKFPLI